MHTKIFFSNIKPAILLSVLQKNLQNHIIMHFTKAQKYSLIITTIILVATLSIFSQVSLSSSPQTLSVAKSVQK